MRASWFVLVLLSLVSGSASAQTAVVRGIGETPDTALSADAAQPGRLVDVDVDGLKALRPAPANALASAASTVTLDLFPDVQLAVALERRDDLPDGTVTFVGSIVGEPAGRAYFAIVDGVLAADVMLPHRRYQVRLRPDGRQEVRAVDGSFLCGVPHEAEGAVATSAVRGAAVSEPILEGPPVVVDVLVVYTPRASTGSGGPAGIRSIIQLAIA